MRLWIVLVVEGERLLLLMSKVTAVSMLVVVGLYGVHGRFPMNLSALQFDSIVHYAPDVVEDYFDFDQLDRNNQDSYLDDLHVH